MACWRIASSSWAPRWRNWKPSWRGSAAPGIASPSVPAPTRCRSRSWRRASGRGDAVFLPAFTYTATAEVPLVLGATPVFVDVDPRTFQIDPAHLRAAHRRGAARRQAAAARADRRRPVRPAGGLAGAARHRSSAKACSRSMTWRRASAARCTAGRWVRRPMPPRPASFRRSRWVPMATAARCSPRATNARRCIAACARTARARRATRCCAPE